MSYLDSADLLPGFLHLLLASINYSPPTPREILLNYGRLCHFSAQHSAVNIHSLRAKPKVIKITNRNKPRESDSSFLLQRYLLHSTTLLIHSTLASLSSLLSLKHRGIFCRIFRLVIPSICNVPPLNIHRSFLHLLQPCSIFMFSMMTTVTII